MPTNASPSTPPEGAERSIARTILIGVIAITAALGAAFLIQLIQGGGSFRTPIWALYLHLATVIPAVPLGGWLLWRKQRGDRVHRVGGYIWVTLMMVTAIDSFWIQSLMGRIGPIHIFSVITIYSLPKAIWLARNGRIKEHERTMKGVYLGMIAAGLFTILPGRFLGSFIFG